MQRDRNDKRRIFFKTRLQIGNNFSDHAAQHGRRRLYAFIFQQVDQLTQGAIVLAVAEGGLERRTMFAAGGTFGYPVEEFGPIRRAQQALAADVTDQAVSGQASSLFQARIANRNSGNANQWGITEPAVAGEQGRKQAFSSGSEQDCQSASRNALLLGPD